MYTTSKSYSCLPGFTTATQLRQVAGTSYKPENHTVYFRVDLAHNLIKCHMSDLPHIIIIYHEYYLTAPASSNKLEDEGMGTTRLHEYIEITDWLYHHLVISILSIYRGSTTAWSA